MSAAACGAPRVLLWQRCEVDEGVPTRDDIGEVEERDRKVIKGDVLGERNKFDVNDVESNYKEEEDDDGLFKFRRAICNTIDDKEIIRIMF
uniref:Uncharacterized protein n=1 Tax=Chenopodium quinoa TaxID=63459 RepID=A0A803N7S7_CHEQI